MNTKIREYLNCSESKSFKETLFSFIDNSGHSDSEIYKKADIDRKLFSKIRCGKDYVPRKNVIFKLGFALDLSKKDFEKLLKSAGYSLSENKFDLVISCCLENNVYDLESVNNYLFAYCNATL